MKLSPTMKDNLLYIHKILSGKGVFVGRPSHYENLIAHNALLKRGLIQEADDAFHTITLTEAGKAMVELLLQEEK